MKNNIGNQHQHPQKNIGKDRDVADALVFIFIIKFVTIFNILIYESQFLEKKTRITFESSIRTQKYRAF